MINNPRFHAELINAYIALDGEPYTMIEAVELLRVLPKFSLKALTTRRTPIVAFPRFVDEPAQGWHSSRSRKAPCLEMPV